MGRDRQRSLSAPIADARVQCLWLHVRDRRPAGLGVRAPVARDLYDGDADATSVDHAAMAEPDHQPVRGRTADRHPVAPPVGPGVRHDDPPFGAARDARARARALDGPTDPDRPRSKADVPISRRSSDGEADGDRW